MSGRRKSLRSADKEGSKKLARDAEAPATGAAAAKVDTSKPVEKPKKMGRGKKKETPESTPKEPASKPKGTRTNENEARTPPKRFGTKRKTPSPEPTEDEDPEKTLVEEYDEPEDIPSPGKKLKIEKKRSEGKSTKTGKGSGKTIKKETTPEPTTEPAASIAAPSSPDPPYEPPVNQGIMRPPPTPESNTVARAIHDAIKPLLALIDPVIKFQEICSKRLPGDLELEAQLATKRLESLVEQLKAQYGVETEKLEAKESDTRPKKVQQKKTTLMDPDDGFERGMSDDEYVDLSPVIEE